MRRPSIQLDPYLLLLLGLSLLALLPLTSPGYFYSAHDGRHSVFFVAMFDEAIRSGALWPRWAMHHNQGYGYPTFLVQAPLAFYTAEFFVLLGAGITQAVKWAWALGYLAGAWGMYALVRTWLLDASTPRSPGTPAAGGAVHLAGLGALVAGLLYTFAPYHLLDLYVRAAFAETLSMAWFPWVFLAFDRLIVRGTGPGWQGRLLLAALSYAALLLTHVFALVAFTPLLMAFVLFRLWLGWRRDEGPALAASVRRTALAAGAGLAALLLAAIFLVPLFVEGPVLVQEDWTRGTYNYTRHWVHWGQLLSPFWGYGYSDDPVGANDGMGFQLGVMLVFFGLVGLVLLLNPRALGPEGEHGPLRAYGRDQSYGHDISWPYAPPEESRPASTGPSRPGELAWLGWFLLLATAGVLAVVTPAAAPLWRSLPLIDVIQFPWRLLALSTFTLSALGGLVVWALVCMGEQDRPPRQLEDGAGVLVLGLMVCFAGFAYSRPASLEPVASWREDGRAVLQFEREHPDMLGYTRFVDERFTTSPLASQYLDGDAPAQEFSPAALARLAVTAGTGTVLQHYSLGHGFGGEVEMETPGTVQVRVFEFPGWQVTIDGSPVPHRLSPPHGLIEVDVPAGRHRIDVWMGTTPARTAGAAIAGGTLLVLVGLWAVGQRAAGRAPRER